MLTKSIRIQWHKFPLYSQMPFFQGYYTTIFLSIIYILTILRIMRIIFVSCTWFIPYITKSCINLKHRAQLPFREFQTLLFTGDFGDLPLPRHFLKLIESYTKYILRKKFLFPFWEIYLKITI